MPTVENINAMHDYIGQELGPSAWIHVDQQRINTFADVTEDHQFIHVDEQAAKAVFGSTIAHGFLTLSMIVPMMSEVSIIPQNVAMGLNYGLNKVRFLQPVKVNSNINLTAKLLSVTDKGDNRYLVAYEVTVHIKGEDKPALIAETLSMLITK